MSAAQAAAALVAAVVESPQCQKMAFGQGLLEPLLELARCRWIDGQVR